MTEIVILFCAFTITIVPWSVAQKYGSAPLISPMHIVAFMAFMGVFVKTIGYVIDPNIAFMTPLLNDPNSALLSYAYVTLFVAGTCAGYVLSVTNRTKTSLGPDAATAVSRVRRDWVLLWVSIATTVIVTVLYFVVRGNIAEYDSLLGADALHNLNRQRITRIDGIEGYGASFSALRSFYGLTVLALLVFFSQLIGPRKNPTALLKCLMVGLAVLVIIVTSGRRVEILAIAMQLFCIYVLLGGRVNPKLVITSAAGLLVIVMLFYLLTALRASETSDFLSSDTGIAVMFDILIRSSFFLDINMPAVIIDRASSDDMYYGASYLYWLFGWIPRELWPEKPPVSIGPAVKALVLGFQGGVGGWNPTGPGEAYLNFSWGGPIVGFLLGAGYRRMEEILLLRDGVRKVAGLWVYPFVAIPLIIGTMQSSFSITVLSAAAKLLICYVFVKVFYISRRNGSPRFRLD